MFGAREYAELFETGRYGRLYLVSSQHARGKIFHIQVLPEGEEAIPNGRSNLCLNEDAVEVYGVVAGQRGWTERYGWLHLGQWQVDFHELVGARREELRRRVAEERDLEQRAEESQRERQARLLASYGIKVLVVRADTSSSAGATQKAASPS